MHLKLISMSPAGSSELFKGRDPVTPIHIPATWPSARITDQIEQMFVELDYVKIFNFV